LAFDVDENGTFSNKRELYSFGPGRGIDGMTLDTEGNIYATAGTKEKCGIYIFSPEGKQLALVKLPADPTNCVFGGGAGNLLYITAGIPRKPGEGSKFGLYRIALKKAGYHVVPLGTNPKR
ncbi:MAG TPA: SMP-30/gluconolactonase/LRE family protein, partial [Pirellulaceae bacterium]|nr:SMP-30/gluconolactonase/LRE family protein [Pirellulaceae bacterium]